jgi:hypothetical protein
MFISTGQHGTATELGEATGWFEALDHRVIGRGLESGVASVLRVHVDEHEWWIDVANASDPSANVMLRLSRHATVFHAVAALRRHVHVSNRPHQSLMSCGGASG